MQLFLITSQLALAMASFPSPIPLPSLPSLFAPDADPSPPDPVAESQIRNTLVTYALSIDSKNFTALSSVFHQDAVANFSEPINVLTGLSEIMGTLEASLAVFAGTQHHYGTQAIRIDDVGACARAVTYFTATHFGKGEAEGQVYYPLLIISTSISLPLCIYIYISSLDLCLECKSFRQLTLLHPLGALCIRAVSGLSHTLGAREMAD